jgi:hypothetical protein
MSANIISMSNCMYTLDDLVLIAETCRDLCKPKQNNQIEITSIHVEKWVPRGTAVTDPSSIPYSGLEFQVHGYHAKDGSPYFRKVIKKYEKKE